MRGYSAIALENPKCLMNIGGAMRAAFCYGAAMIVVGGPRVKNIGRAPTDTNAVWKHIPLIEADDVLAHMPFGCVPVAVELTADAMDLTSYAHPERAFYIFGPEDGSVKKETLAKCRDVVKAPTRHCMNLAAAVNVVLYDRAAKRGSFDYIATRAKA